MHISRTLIITMILAVAFIFGCSNNRSDVGVVTPDRQSEWNPQIAQVNKALPRIAIYIANSGDDSNKGRLVAKPVRTIRRAVDIANSFNNHDVSILFVGDEYELLASDMVFNLEGTIMVNDPTILSLSRYGNSSEKIRITTELV